MNDNQETLNELAKHAEMTNPLAELLSLRHGDQVEEIEEFLHGIGYFELSSGWTIDDGSFKKRPATDEECRTAVLEWNFEPVSIDVTGDIAEQISDQLAVIGKRLLRAARGVGVARSAGTLSEPRLNRVFCVMRDGEIIARSPSKSTALVCAVRNDGVYFEETDPSDPSGD